MWEVVRMLRYIRVYIVMGSKQVYDGVVLCNIDGDLVYYRRIMGIPIEIINRVIIIAVVLYIFGAAFIGLFTCVQK